MTLYLFALLIGVIAGLRAMTAPAAVSWAAWIGVLPLAGTPLAFLGSIITAGIFTVLAIAELISDQLPKTPSRKVPPQFIARIVMGGISGAAIGMASDAWIGGLIAGVVGSVVGTLVGAEARGGMARAFGRDAPAAFIEDGVAILGAIAIVALLA